MTFDPTQPEAGKPLVATVTDLDGNVTGTAWEWSKSTTSTGRFTPISGATSDTYTPAVGDLDHYLKAKASYTDPEGSGKSAEDTTTAAVTAGNTPPTFPDDDGNSGPDPLTFKVEENSAAATVVGTVLADESDTGDTLTYSLGEEPAQVTAFISVFVLNESNGQITVKADDSLDHETTDTYSFDIGVSDGKDAAGDTDTATIDSTVAVTINVTDVNEPPEFDENGPATRTVAENTGTGENIGAPLAATDPDAGATLTYTLEGTGTDKDSFTIDDNGQIKTKAGVTYNYEAKDTYSFTVKASDGTASDTIDVTINVNDVNETPTFPSTETGARSVAENTPSSQAIGAPVAATDPDNEKTPNTQTLTYTLGGTDAASFDIDTSSGQLLTKDALDHDTKATYTVAVSVRDSKDDSGNDDMADDDTIAVTITVTGENEPPEFAAETDTRNIAENTDSGQDIGLPVAATDPDNGDTLTYTLDTTSDAVFDLDDLGQLKTEAALDFEAKDGYTVTVTATDGSGDTDTIDVTITVTNVDEDGAVTFDPTPPKAGTLLIATVTDPDGNVSGDTREWLISNNPNTGFTAIANEISDNYTPTADDVDKYLKVEVSYTDDEGSGKSAEGTTAAVAAANTPPSFPGGENPTPITLTVAENSLANTQVGIVSATDSDTGDTLIYSLEGSQAQKDAFNAAFNLDTSTGEITVFTDDSLDHETTPSYTFDIGVRDDKDDADAFDNAVDSTVAVTINVTDVNEAPEFDPDEDVARTVAENTGPGENIGDPFTATDPDVGATLTYVLSGTDADSFTIETVSGEGQLKTKTGVTYDYETKAIYSVTVGVHDGKDADGDSDTATDATIDVIIDVTDVNEAPEFPPNETGTRNVVENTDPNENIGNPVEAEDPENDSLTYTLGGTDAGSFNFVATSGQLQTKDALDKETKSSYSVTVSVSDGKDASGDPDTAPDNTINVTITVTGQDEPPEFDAGPVTRTVDENTEAGQNVGAPVTATDPEDSTLIYTLEGTDAASFTIVESSGQLKTKTGVTYNHETEASYSVAVKADDGNGGTDTIDVTINVTDVDEPPGKPDAPTVAAKTGTHDALHVTWTAPTNTGPAIDSYAVQYRKHDVTGWTDGTGTITGTTTTFDITGLLPDTEYSARVQATNDEGDSDWSDEGEGTTDAKLETDWFELTVDYGAATYDVTEGSSVTVTVELSNTHGPKEADRKLAVPITETLGNAEASDYTVNGLTSNDLAFVPGETSKTFTVIASRDSDRSDETLTLGFGTLPTKVTAGSSATALVTIDDNTPGSSTPPRPVNHRPVFNPGTVQPMSVAENTVSGTDIGDPITATDSDANHTLTYSLDAVSAAVFTIVAGTGQLQTKAALNYEAEDSYTVTVIAKDSTQAQTTIDVTTNVTDVDEPPGKPDAPTVAAKTDTHDALTVTWTAPTNTGPAIDSYDVEYRKHDVTEWSAVTGPIDGTTTTIDITGLLPDTEYFARVQATNDEGTGEWSDEGSGTTAIKPGAEWFDLTVNYGAATYTVTEGSSVDITVELSKDGTAQAADRKLAIPITDTGVNTETGDYTVSGLTSDALAFVPGENSKTFEISALKDNDGDDETVDLGFGSTLPTKVTVGTVVASSQVTIDDNYLGSGGGGGGGGGSPPVKNPPANNPPVITPPVKNPPANNPPVITPPVKNPPAFNPPVITPPVKNPPAFNPGTVETISVAENTVAGTDIGDPVTAVDSDANDTLTYSLDTASAKVFTIVDDTGQLQTKGALNYEVKNSYTVTVTATDSAGATATTDVTINVTDVDEPPGKPDAPTVGPASTNGHNTLSVSWNAPYNTGPAITSYTVEYRKHDSTEWTADNLTISRHDRNHHRLASRYAVCGDATGHQRRRHRRVVERGVREHCGRSRVRTSRLDRQLRRGSLRRQRGQQRNRHRCPVGRSRPGAGHSHYHHGGHGGIR